MFSSLAELRSTRRLHAPRPRCALPVTAIGAPKQQDAALKATPNLRPEELGGSTSFAICYNIIYRVIYRIRTGTNERHCTKVWTAPPVGAHNQTSWCPSQDLLHWKSHVCSLTHKLAPSNTVQRYQLHIIRSSLFACLATQRCRKCFPKDWWQGSCQDGRGSNARPTSPGAIKRQISETSRRIFKVGKSGIRESHMLFP